MTGSPSSIIHPKLLTGQKRYQKENAARNDGNAKTRDRNNSDMSDQKIFYKNNLFHP